jgi:hypothetical protein
VIGADARLYALESEINRLRQSATSGAERERLHLLVSQRAAVSKAAQEKYKSAYAIELKRAQKAARANPQPKAAPKRPRKVKRVATQTEMVHSQAVQTLLERQREYKANPTPANEKRVRDAWAVLHHSEGQIGFRPAVRKG